MSDTTDYLVFKLKGENWNWSRQNNNQSEVGEVSHHQSGSSQCLFLLKAPSFIVC